MKIAIFSATLPPYPCGVGKHAFCLADALVKAEQMVTVVTLSTHDPLPEHRFNLDDTLVKFGLKEYWGWARRNKNKYEMVHVQYPTKLNRRGVSIILLPWILRIWGFKTTLTLHELSEASVLGKIRNIVLAAGFATIILPNPQDRKWLWFRSKSLRHISLGPTLIGGPAVIQPVAKNSIGFLGFMDGSKGEEDLLRCLPEIGLPVKAYFLSRFDPDHNHHHHYLETIINQLEIANMVEWVNPADDQMIINYLHSVTVVALPFKRGVTKRNSTLLEAICAHKPTIVTDGGVLPEYLQDKQNCLMVEPGQLSQLATAIRLLCADERLRQHISHGTQELSKRFNWQTIARQTLDVYR